MKLRVLKAIYFATVCLPPPFLLVLYPMVFIWHVRFPATLIAYYPVYFWAGFVLLVVDLWRSNQPRKVKVLWSILNAFLGVICLPIYWFRYVLRWPNSTA